MKKYLVAVIALAIFLGLGIFANNYTGAHPITCTVISTDRSAGLSSMGVQTSDCGMLRVDSSFFHKTDAEKTYAKIEVGNRYNFKTYTASFLFNAKPSVIYKATLDTCK